MKDTRNAKSKPNNNSGGGGGGCGCLTTLVCLAVLLFLFALSQGQDLQEASTWALKGAGMTLGAWVGIVCVGLPVVVLGTLGGVGLAALVHDRAEKRRRKRWGLKPDPWP